MRTLLQHNCGKGKLNYGYDIFMNQTSGGLIEEFSINSCCGGGCNAVTNVVFCPFCGKALVKEDLVEIEDN